MAKTSTILNGFRRKIFLSLGLAAFTAVAFATLTSGPVNREKPRKSLLSVKHVTSPGKFSLHSGYHFRGSQVISQDNKFLNLNTVVTYQQGNITYNLPMRKKVALNGKVVFNPNAASRTAR